MQQPSTDMAAIPAKTDTMWTSHCSDVEIPAVVSVGKPPSDSQQDREQGRKRRHLKAEVDHCVKPASNRDRAGKDDHRAHPPLSGLCAGATESAFKAALPLWIVKLKPTTRSGQTHRRAYPT